MSGALQGAGSSFWERKLQRNPSGASNCRVYRARRVAPARCLDEGAGSTAGCVDDNAGDPSVGDQWGPDGCQGHGREGRPGVGGEPRDDRRGGECSDCAIRQARLPNHRQVAGHCACCQEKHPGQQAGRQGRRARDGKYQVEVPGTGA